MPKNIEKLGSYEDFKFNSLLDADEPDLEKLKKYVFGLLQDKARAQDARDLANTEIAKVEEERDGLKAELASKGDPDLAKRLEETEAKLKKAQDDLAEVDRQKLATTVAEGAGLSAKQAEYLKGTTEDELKASAEKFIKDNGIDVSKSDEDEDEDDEDDNPLRRSPRRVTNPGDPKPGSGPDKEPDYEKLVAGWDTRTL